MSSSETRRPCLQVHRERFLPPGQNPGCHARGVRLRKVGEIKADGIDGDVIMKYHETSELSQPLSGCWFKKKNTQKNTEERWFQVASFTSAFEF
jgi:hypothetical protein